MKLELTKGYADVPVWCAQSEDFPIAASADTPEAAAKKLRELIAEYLGHEQK